MIDSLLIYSIIYFHFLILKEFQYFMIFDFNCLENQIKFNGNDHLAHSSSRIPV